MLPALPTPESRIRHVPKAHILPTRQEESTSHSPDNSNQVVNPKPINLSREGHSKQVRLQVCYSRLKKAHSRWGNGRICSGSATCELQGLRKRLRHSSKNRLKCVYSRGAPRLIGGPPKPCRESPRLCSLTSDKMRLILLFSNPQHSGKVCGWDTWTRTYLNPPI